MGHMEDDELEPGQDDLGKEARPGSGIDGKMKHVRSTGSIGGHDVYTDHKAGDPAQLTPPAELDRTVQRRSGSPVKSGFRDTIQNGMEVIGEIFSRVVSAV